MVPPAPPADARILIVDDQDANVVLLRRLLRTAGYEDVLSTTDSVGALGMVADHRPGLVLLDWHMPGRSGAEILQELRADRRWPDLRIIVLTADPQVRTVALELGADDFISTPFDAVEVLLRIRNAVRIRSLHQELRSRNAVLEERVRERTAELEEANTSLRGLDEMRRDFVAMASHEMRTPLTVVRGFVELWTSSGDALEGPEVRASLGAVRRNVRRLEHLVNNLLLASRIETGGSGHRRRPFDLCSLLHATVEQVMDDDAVAVECSIRDPVGGDAELISQAVTNLLFNAQRYGQPPVEVRAAPAEDGVVVTVSDHGSGVPDEFVPHLFERFAQASTGDRREAQGAGLGLWVSRKIVELHGGTLSYEPRAGAGASFTLFLPEPAQPR